MFFYLMTNCFYFEFIECINLFDLFHFYDVVRKYDGKE